MVFIEHLTHKTGKFIFSSDYDKEKVSSKFVESEVLYSAVCELPILPQIASQLREDLVRRSIFGTAAIEGNALTEEEVGVVLQRDSESEVDFANRSELEIENLKKIYSLLDGIEEEEPWLVTEDFVKKVHEVLTNKIDYHHNSPGLYRNEPVYVGDVEHGGVYTPPKTLDDVRTLMRMFEEWVNGEPVVKMPPIIRACLAHYHLAKIHPFQDGNGRTARFIEAMIMDKAGVKFLPEMMSNYYYKNIDAYFVAFSKTHQTKTKGDVTPFVEFYLDGLVQSLREVKADITFFIRQMSLKDFYYFQKREKVLTKRQRDLLLVSIEMGLSFTLGELFSSPVFRPLYSDVSEATARRDMKKLHAGGYLLFEPESKRYSINLRMLG